MERTPWVSEWAFTTGGYKLFKSTIVYTCFPVNSLGSAVFGTIIVGLDQREMFGETIRALSNNSNSSQTYWVCFTGNVYGSVQ